MAQEHTLMEAPPQLPRYWHFLWMFFMQPVTLHYQLKACGIDNLNITGIAWWRQHKTVGVAYFSYMLRMHFVLMMVSLMAFLWVLLWGEIFHIPLDLRKAAIGVVIGTAAGIAGSVLVGVGFGLAFSMVVGVSLGVSFGGTGSLAVNFAIRVLDDVAVGVASGVSVGGALSVLMGLKWGVEPHASNGLFFCVCFGFVFGAVFGVAFSLAFGVAFLGAYYRLLLYPLELVCQLFVRHRNAQKSSGRFFSPLQYHDLAYLPYPFFAQQIVAIAQTEPRLAQRLIHAANRSAGQKRGGANALGELRAKELTALVADRGFAAIAECRGQWLPGLDNDSPLLTTLAQAARFMLAGVGALSPHISMQHLDAAAKQLQALENQLLTSKEPLARFLPPVLQTWSAVLEATRSEAAAKAQTMLPNPFVTGLPLSPSMAWGQAVFRGREILIEQVETLLADQQNTTSIALIGPRRCGKSSLLNMLRVMLPDTIVVLFDLQSNPVDTPTAFYEALAHTAREQAQRSHRLQLPELVFTTQNGQQKSPIEALKQWLDQLEQFSTQHRILICIDEFERLETLFPDQNRELLQLMGLFRATIQHGRRVRLLVAGAAPFDELGTLWNDHFINLREMRLGFLDEETVVQLLTKPIEEFPPGAISGELAHEIYRRSRGQPFLTQVYGYALVETLNRSKRKSATLDDIKQIEPELLSSYTYYFRGIWQEVPPEGQAALTALAHGEPMTLARETKRWLRRRMLVDDDGQLLVPLFGRWIREKDEMV